MRAQYPSHLQNIMCAHPDHIRVRRCVRARSDIRLLLEPRHPGPVRAWAAFYDDAGAVVGLSVGGVEPGRSLGLRAVIPRLAGPSGGFRVLARHVPNRDALEVPACGRKEGLDHLAVVIPVRNRETELRGVLASLCAQSVPPSRFSVVVVDDDSEDGSLAVAHEYERTLDLRVLRHSRRRGRAAARNSGLRAVTSEVVLFLDADMIADRSLVEEHARAQREGRCVGLGRRGHVSRSVLRHMELGTVEDAVSVSHCRAVRTGRADDGRAHWYQVTENLAWEAFPWMHVRTGNLSVPADLAHRVGFDEGYSGWGYEDIDFGLRLHAAELGIRFRPLPVAAAFHVEHARDTQAEEREALQNRRRLLRSILGANGLSPAPLLREADGPCSSVGHP